MFSDFQKLKEFMTSELVTQEVLKKCFRQKENDTRREFGSTKRNTSIDVVTVCGTRPNRHRSRPSEEGRMLGKKRDLDSTQT